jgi:hypothetical protein
MEICLAFYYMRQTLRSKSGWKLMKLFRSSRVFLILGIVMDTTCTITICIQFAYVSTYLASYFNLDTRLTSYTFYLVCCWKNRSVSTTLFLFHSKPDKSSMHKPFCSNMTLDVASSHLQNMDSSYVCSNDLFVWGYRAYISDF